VIELRQGRWQDTLGIVECGALITDPPYGKRTHENQKHGRKRVNQERKIGGDWVSSRGIGYDHMTPELIAEFVQSWSPRVHGWMAIFCSHDLIPHYERQLELAGRYVFAPIPTVQIGMNVRLAGDGPSNWCCWLIVARPTGKPRDGRKKWGTKPGAYVGNAFDLGQTMTTATRRANVVGSKPLWLMRAIVRDYSERGQLVIDPFAGGASTLIAAASLGRRSIGSELDPVTCAYAQSRIDHWQAMPLFEPGQQLELGAL
jgi:hypothetical protein